MQEVQSLGWEDPREEEMATHSSILAWRIPWTGVLEDYSPWGLKELDMTEHARTRPSEMAASSMPIFQMRTGSEHELLSPGHRTGKQSSWDSH